MTGNYKYDNLELSNPTVEVISYFVDVQNDSFKMEVYLYDDKDGATITLPHPMQDSQPMPQSTQQPALSQWAENYLQNFKI